MNTYYQKDNLTPSLLDRLTDHSPRNKKETKNLSILSISQYRQNVLRDILNLLNSDMLFSDLTANYIYQGDKNTDQIPSNVWSSCINYGTPSLSGTVISNVDWFVIEKEITRALIAFEERLLPDTIKVTVHLQSSKMIHDSELVIEIEGKLKMAQYDEEFWLKTKVDIETGSFSLVEDR